MIDAETLARAYLELANRGVVPMEIQLPSRRDLLAGMALQGLLAHCGPGAHRVPGDAETAVAYADALIAALDAPKEGKS